MTSIAYSGFEEITKTEIGSESASNKSTHSFLASPYQVLKSQYQTCFSFSKTQ
jgi:hypothetical protein